MSTIFIIDDEPAQVAALQGMLVHAEHEYEVAASGDEARALLRSRGEDANAVLLDWVLHDVDGVELLRWIKAQPELAFAEVVIQSSELVPEKIQTGIDCGAYYYLTKPYAPAQLQAIVRAAVASSRFRRAIVTEANEASDVLRLLDHGTFLVRTVHEAQTLSARLASACNAPDKGMGLFELMLNAVEHGNLGIDYEDKTRLLEQERHAKELERRLELPENLDKRVTVEVRRGENGLELTIRDCGPGFDYRKYLTVDPQRMFDTHGRGILVAGSLLEIEFVDPGNEVRVSMAFER